MKQRANIIRMKLEWIFFNITVNYALSFQNPVLITYRWIKYPASTIIKPTEFMYVHSHCECYAYSCSTKHHRINTIIQYSTHNIRRLALYWYNNIKAIYSILHNRITKIVTSWPEKLVSTETCHRSKYRNLSLTKYNNNFP